jgi:hypothetical protein
MLSPTKPLCRLRDIKSFNYLTKEAPKSIIGENAEFSSCFGDAIDVCRTTSLGCIDHMRRNILERVWEL